MEDFEGWEVLPDDGFLEIHDDDDGEKIFSRKFGGGSNSVFKNYFICPSKPKSPQFVDSTERVPKQLVTVPIQLEPADDDEKLPDQEFLKQLSKGDPVLINLSPSAMPEKIGATDMTGAMEADRDPVPQVSFKKMKEPEYLEMKMDSPRSNGRGMKPQIDAANFQFDDKGDAFMGEALESKISSPKFRSDEEKTINAISMDAEAEKEVTWVENSGGVNVWKWSLTGIGAICSFGIAAATVCIIILGGRQKSRQHQDNQKLQFHIYAEDKRFRQVVRQASKLNEAISAVRGGGGGVPLTRAHITFGGYYDGL